MAAKERKDGEKPKGIDATAREIPKPIDPLGDAMQARMHALANQEKIKLLISGKVPCSNEMVDYLVGQYRGARAEYDGTDSLVRELEAKLVAAKEKRLVLQGGVNKYLEDIRHWLERDEQEKRSRESAREAYNSEARKKQFEKVVGKKDEPPNGEAPPKDGEPKTEPVDETKH